MMKVSFILPIYNVEHYLPACVDSLLAQTYPDFEIILVDDGSPDQCGRICDAYARKEPRVRVLHKKNGGLSDARNAGLAVAEGDYVIFVDSDDFWVGSEALADLMKVVEAHPSCDFIGFNCSYYYEDTNTYTPWVPYDESLAKPSGKDAVMHALVASGTMPMSACLKVISRKSLQEMQLTFMKGLLSEDIPWFIDLLDGSKQCMFVNHYVYAYRQGREGSITTSGGERAFESLLTIIRHELDRLSARGLSTEAKNDLRSFLAYEYCILLSLVSSLRPEIQQAKRQELRSYQWLLKYTTNPKVRKAAWVNKLFGLRVTEWVLAFYLNRVRK